MKIYRCNPEKGREFCSKPERYCGRYCTMTYNEMYSDDKKPLPMEEVEAENERIRKLYEEDRKEKANGSS